MGKGPSKNGDVFNVLTKLFRSRRVQLCALSTNAVMVPQYCRMSAYIRSDTMSLLLKMNRVNRACVRGSAVCPKSNSS
jgi:hypothetical protein